LVNKIVEVFKSENPGIDVEIINAGVGELLTRIQAEKSHPRGDVFFGASVEAYLSALDLFAPYQTKDTHEIMVSMRKRRSVRVDVSAPDKIVG
jgi:iron(III) transport system substrate-binding protein